MSKMLSKETCPRMPGRRIVAGFRVPGSFATQALQPSNEMGGGRKFRALEVGAPMCIHSRYLSDRYRLDLVRPH